MSFLLSFLDQFFVQKPPEPSQDALTFFPDEVVCQIFGSFTPQELAGRISRVCKRWHRLAFDEALWRKFDIRQVFPEHRIKIIDGEFWKEFDLKAIGLEVDDLAISNRRAIPCLAKIFAMMKERKLEIEDNKGVTILTLPKGLTIDKLLVISALAKRKAIEFQFHEDSLDMLRGDPIDKTYRVVITNGILMKSRRCSLAMHWEYMRLISASMPFGIEASSLAVATRIRSNERLFGDNPQTYTRCVESDEDRPWRLVVGNFASPSIKVSICDHGLYPNVGVAAVWDLPDSEKS